MTTAPAAVRASRSRRRTRTAPGRHDAGVDPAQPQLAAGRLVHELERLAAEAGAELRAARVRLLRDLDDGLADREPRPGREVVDAEVEIDVELVAGERPALAAPGDEVGGAGVHQRQLGVSGFAEPSGRLRDPRASQTSPTSPSSRSSTPSSSTSRSFSAGRRTISSTVPAAAGDSRISGQPCGELVCAAVLHARKPTWQA